MYDRRNHGLAVALAGPEAKEAVLSTLNKDLFIRGVGFGPDRLECYAQDAELDVPTFPLTNGSDLHFEGKYQLARMSAGYGRDGPRIGGGHHAGNIAVNAEPAIQSRQASAYFTTTTFGGI